MSDWEELGRQLEIPDRNLKEIFLDSWYKGTNRQRSEMIDKWRRYVVNASWEKLCKALDMMGEKVLAHEIRSATS